MNHCTDQLIYVLAVTFLCFLSHSLPYETCINRQFRSSVNPRSGRNNIPKLCRKVAYVTVRMQI